MLCPFLMQAVGKNTLKRRTRIYRKLFLKEVQFPSKLVLYIETVLGDFYHRIN